MQKVTQIVVPVLLGVSILTSPALHAGFFDSFLHGLGKGFGDRVGQNSAQYLWTHHRKKLIIGTCIVVGLWYWKKHEDEKKRNRQDQYCHTNE